MTKKRMTNREYAKKMKGFVDACDQAGVKPTSRQASKWRRKKGLAHQLRSAYKGE